MTLELFEKCGACNSEFKVQLLDGNETLGIMYLDHWEKNHKCALYTATSTIGLNPNQSIWINTTANTTAYQSVKISEACCSNCAEERSSCNCPCYGDE